MDSVKLQQTLEANTAPAVKRLKQKTGWRETTLTAPKKNTADEPEEVQLKAKLLWDLFFPFSVNWTVKKKKIEK